MDVGGSKPNRQDLVIAKIDANKKKLTILHKESVLNKLSIDGGRSYLLSDADVLLKDGAKRYSAYKLKDILGGARWSLKTQCFALSPERKMAIGFDSGFKLLDVQSNSVYGEIGDLPGLLSFTNKLDLGYKAGFALNDNAKCIAALDRVSDPISLHYFVSSGNGYSSGLSMVVDAGFDLVGVSGVSEPEIVLYKRIKNLGGTCILINALTGGKREFNLPGKPIVDSFATQIVCLPVGVEYQMLKGQKLKVLIFDLRGKEIGNMLVDIDKIFE